MEFNFDNYIQFCKDFKLIPSRYKNLITFRLYCNGDFTILFNIKGDY